MATRVIWYGDQVKRNVHDATRKGIDQVMALCVATSKERAPKQTTTLQGSIQMRAAVDLGTKIVGFWGSFNVAYAIFVELGTRPHVILPRIKKALWWEGAPHPVSIVHHPGTKEHPFLEPSANMHYPKLTRFIKQGIK